MTPLRATVNRCVLGLLGLLALAGGGLLCVSALARQGTLPFVPPSWWPLLTGDRLLADRTAWVAHSWWPVAAIGIPAALLVLMLWWLAAQLRTRPARLLGSRHPGVRLRITALEGAFDEEAARLPEVASSRLRLGGPPEGLRGVLTVRLTPQADPAGILDTLATTSLPRGGEAVGGARPHAAIRFRIRAGRGQRVR